MASTRSKRRPGGRPSVGGKVFSIRFPDDVVAKINALRSEDVSFGTYVALVVASVVITPEEKAIRECQLHNTLRGVTPEMLMAASKAK